MNIQKKKQLIKLIIVPTREFTKHMKFFKNSTEVGRSDIEVKDKYCICIKAKKRYTNPLVIDESGTIKRISDISEKGKNIIEDIKNFEDSKYAYLDIEVQFLLIVEQLNINNKYGGLQ